MEEGICVIGFRGWTPLASRLIERPLSSLE